MRIPSPSPVPVAGLLAMVTLGACQTQQVIPPQEQLLGAEAIVADDAVGGAYLGLTLEESLAGSLDDLDFLAGLDVRDVAEGSPARLAGVRRGDRIAKAGSVELTDLDQWGAILAGMEAGDALDLVVERGGAEHDVSVVAGTRGGGSLPPPTRWVEHWRGRLVAETRGGPDGVQAVVVELRPGSSLEGDVTPGDVIVSWDDDPVRGAEDLIERCARAEFGASVRLGILRDGVRHDTKVDLWSPPRHTTRFGIPILFNYSASVDGTEKEWSVLDLWLLSLFSYERDGETRTYSILRWFDWQTGTGELTEVDDPFTGEPRP